MPADALEEIGEILASMPLFASMTPREKLELSAKAHRKSYHAGEVIFHKDDPGLTLYMIVDGLVKIALPSEDGGEAVLALLTKGEFFGELSLLDGQSRSASAIAMEPTLTVVLHRDDFLSFVQEHPGVAMSMLSTLSQRLRRADDVISDAVFLDIPSRLAKKLVELAESFGRHVADGVEIDLRLRQQELASMVGTTRESVNRALSVLEHSGAIKMDRQKITILQLNRLKDAAST